MPKRSWSRLSPRTRRFVVAGGAVDASLKVAALIDLTRRPPDQVRGSKARWATAIVLINSVGLVPITYFVYGRRRD